MMPEHCAAAWEALQQGARRAVAEVQAVFAAFDPAREGAATRAFRRAVAS